MKSHFKNNEIEFKYLINNECTNDDISPILEIYRVKLFYNIQHYFINYQIKTFGYKSFQKKKNFTRTLTGIFSSWIFVQFSRNDCNKDPLIPSGNIDNESLEVTLYNMIQNPNDSEEIKLQKKKKVKESLEKLNLNKFCNDAVELLQKYKKSKYYLEKKEDYNIIKSKVICNKNNKYLYKFTIKLPFILNINLYTIINNILISVDVYNNLKNKIIDNKYFKEKIKNNTTDNEKELDKIIWILLLRYNILNSENHQLSLTENIFTNLKDKHGFNCELFSSSFNSNLDYYCSIFSDIEKYVGSYGSFYNFEMIEGCYTFNPPFENKIMEKAVDNIFRDLTIAKLNNRKLLILLTIPIWDLNTLKMIDEKIPNIEYEEYNTINLLKSSEYLIDIVPYSRRKFTYIDKLNNNYKNKTLSNTYVITLGTNVIINKINYLKNIFEKKNI